jgi:hypothetical protein
MKFRQKFRFNAGFEMQIIDVLGDQELEFTESLKRHDCKMTRVWFDVMP